MGDLTNTAFCSQSCRKSMATKKSNEKWITSPVEKKRKYTLRQLDRIFEWKRTHDDESWTKKFQGERM